MKKTISFIMIVLFICIIFCSCSNLVVLSSDGLNKSEPVTLKEECNITKSDERRDIREIAYNQLTPEDKNHISGTWENSELSTIILKGYVAKHATSSFVGNKVYMIDFPTKDISIPNNMIVYLEMDTYKLIGYGLVD